MAPTLLNYREYFNEAPDDDEILRMVEYYPTFSPDYRFGFLIGYFEGLTFNELLKRKLKSQDIDINELSPQSKGGHSKWVGAKVEKILMRILYLRYRLDGDMTRIKANQELMSLFSAKNQKTKDAGQARIRNYTRSSVLDN